MACLLLLWLAIQVRFFLAFQFGRGVKVMYELKYIFQQENELLASSSIRNKNLMHAND